MLLRLVGAVAVSLVTSAALADITPIADVKRGQSVVVEGVVDRFFDTDEIRLRDDSGTLRVYLGSQTLPLRSGERIVIEGIMDDSLVMNELYAREITRENGEKISVSNTYD
ncbi:hypothetical protein [Aestuariivita sp.]|jgi:uncharacterized protein YdeI (BOF family)|uniref:hypothetical protein n=1 Tax=Aestuariivita sp. TaxID=1872407 RepID=UPI00216D98E9|nr:hypothetical protein [Aestuariivita sp.]MCE8005645.1 hypothetical protein [Aestuariivita sp.]